MVWQWLTNTIQSQKLQKPNKTESTFGFTVFLYDRQVAKKKQLLFKIKWI